MNQQEMGGIPPWVMSFLVHVVKRGCGILVCWIDAAAEANAQQAHSIAGGSNGRGKAIELSGKCGTIKG